MPRVLAGHRAAMSQLLPTLPVPREADMQPLWRFGGEPDTLPRPAGPGRSHDNEGLTATCLPAGRRMVFLAVDPEPEFVGAPVDTGSWRRQL
jgi:hypothetical protein